MRKVFKLAVSVAGLIIMLLVNKHVAVSVSAVSHCYQPQSGDAVRIQGEGVLPTFGPTCAVAPSPQPTSPPKGGPLPTNPATPTPPVSGNMAATATVFIGGVLFILFGVSFAFLKVKNG